MKQRTYPLVLAGNVYASRGNAYACKHQRWRVVTRSRR